MLFCKFRVWSNRTIFSGWVRVQVTSLSRGAQSLSRYSAELFGVVSQASRSRPRWLKLAAEARRAGMTTPSNLGENLLNGRDLAAARDAYQQGDAEASKTAHTAGVMLQCQNATLGSAQARHPRLLRGAWQLWQLSDLPGSGRSTERPATASVARTSRVQRRH